MHAHAVYKWDGLDVNTLTKRLASLLACVCGVKTPDRRALSSAHGDDALTPSSAAARARPSALWEACQKAQRHTHTHSRAQLPKWGALYAPRTLRPHWHCDWAGGRFVCPPNRPKHSSAIMRADVFIRASISLFVSGEMWSRSGAETCFKDGRHARQWGCPLNATRFLRFSVYMPGVMQALMIMNGIAPRFNGVSRRCLNFCK